MPTRDTVARIGHEGVESVIDDAQKQEIIRISRLRAVGGAVAHGPVVAAVSGVESRNDRIRLDAESTLQNPEAFGDHEIYHELALKWVRKVETGEVDFLD